MPDSAKELSGKIAVVTGAARGMGYAVAKRLADVGASIVINDATMLPNPCKINPLPSATGILSASLSVSRPKKPLCVRALVGFRHNVVTVEHGACLVSHDGHDYFFGNAL